MVEADGRRVGPYVDADLQTVVWSIDRSALSAEALPWFEPLNSLSYEPSAIHPERRLSMLFKE